MDIFHRISTGWRWLQIQWAVTQKWLQQSPPATDRWFEIVNQICKTERLNRLTGHFIRNTVPLLIHAIIQSANYVAAVTYWKWPGDISPSTHTVASDSYSWLKPAVFCCCSTCISWFQFWNAFLLTLVVKVQLLYTSWTRLPSELSGFCPEDCSSLGVFFLFHSILCKR